MPTNRVRTAFVLALLCITTAGCTIMHSEPTAEVVYSDSAYDTTTHYHDILKAYGPPAQISALGDGMVWLYEDVRLIERQIGLGFDDAGMLSLFKFNIATGVGDYQGWVLTFDEKGFLNSSAMVDDVLNLGSGAGFQFILTVSSLVNITDVRGTAVQEQWGQGLLTDLPRGLNRQQDLNLGKHGVQLLTTPAYTGQQTLSEP